MNKKLLNLLPLGLLFCSLSYSQSYVGHQVDNYSGIHGVILNPSNVVDSRMRTDINLISVSGFAGSDYFGMDLGSIFNGTEGFKFEDEVRRFPGDNNHFFLNLDVLGPSFMFKLSPKSSIAFTSRARAFFNLNNVNGRLYENIETGFDLTENFDFEMKQFNGNMHAWGELGITYGRVLVDGEKHYLKGGATFKYLQGAGSAFYGAPLIVGEYNPDLQRLTTAGTFSYGSTTGFDSEDINADNLSPGFGGDIGFTYEYRPHKEFDTVSKVPSDYKLKIGVSVTDIGSITYSDTRVTRYNINSTIDSGIFEEEDFADVLEQGYTSTDEVEDVTISLPTALHAVIDYNIRRRFYVSVHSSISLVSQDDHLTNSILNTATVSPRFEAKWFSFYLPVSFRQHDGFAAGTGLRLGPLTVGSSSIISNYLFDVSKTTDFYVGLKIPVYR